MTDHHPAPNEPERKPIQNLYPGRPDYTGPRRGWFTFIHHNRPIGWSYDILERLVVIDTKKPFHERALRRWCLAWVDPQTLPAGYAQAWQAYRQAWQASVKAMLAAQAALLALALALVPEAPWDGKQLVFPEPNQEETP